MENSQNVLFLNITKENEFELDEAAFWAQLNEYTDLACAILATLGLFFNYLVFKTANHLPRSNSAYLLLHLAVWDSVSALMIGVFRFGLDYFGVLAFENVSNVFILA